MRPIAFTAALLFLSMPVLRAEDSLRAAKDLYASAAYEDALSMLGRLTEAPGAADAGRQVDQYRAFCLFALGRTGEAETIAESIIRKDPLTQLDPADASPRVESMFTRVRQRLLPALIRDRVRRGTSGVSEKDFAAAEPPLLEARRMIAEAEKIGVTGEGLNDVRVLIDGFLQLIRTANEPPPPRHTPAAANAVTAAREPQPEPAPPSPARPRFYTGDDPGVSSPIAISQRVPEMPETMLKVVRGTGDVQVFIDEAGDVVDVVVRKSLHPIYDALVVNAARRWKYRPAMKDGAPVRFVKRIELVVP